MSVLSDYEIKEFVKSGDIKIEPFEEANLEPASYDCRIGKVLVAGRGIVDPNKERVILRTGEWAEIITLERIELSTKLVASYGLRSSITRRGIDWFGGPQIDPGYKGRIVVSIFNASSETFEINYGEPFLTLVFHRLGKEASRGYEGRFQGLDDFPNEDVVRMMKLETPTLGDVVTAVGILENTVQKLTENVNRMANDISWVKNLLFAILIAIIIGLCVSILPKFF
jgi:dCTP deaminase